MSFAPAHARARGNPEETGSPLPRGRAEHIIAIAGTELVADPAGALYWPEQRLLAAADLHLEKGSSFAARGQLLPPYDTAATLSRLTQLVLRYAPRIVIALGDSFHDGGAPARLDVADRQSILGLQRGREWIWITGNHDPEPAERIGGVFEPELQIGSLTFRHLPSRASGEICGHLHPAARIAHRGRSVRRRCFAADAHRIVMPALGAFAGGLNVREAAFSDLFGTLAFTAHMLGEDRLYAFPAKRCLAD